MSVTAPALEVSLNRILVATDFSEASAKALHHAIPIARRYEAKFYLAHVVSQAGAPLAGALRTEEAAICDLRSLETQLVQAGALAGIPHEVVVRHGDVWEQLDQIVRQENVDLIVVGTHGRTGFRKIVLGSVAEEIFRHALRPVLTVGPGAPADPTPESNLRHILYPTDLSVESAAAAPYAISAAIRNNARLTLLHVVELHETEDAERSTVLQNRLRNFLPRSYALPYNLNFTLEAGPTDETILAFAREHHADLIVMGLRSPNTLVDRLLWLHAYEIIRGASCPVLTIRSAK